MNPTSPIAAFAIFVAGVIGAVYIFSYGYWAAGLLVVILAGETASNVARAHAYVKDAVEE